jgi:hypothetical protein
VSSGRDAADRVARRIADRAWFLLYDVRRAFRTAWIAGIADARARADDLLWSLEGWRQRMAPQRPPAVVAAAGGGGKRMALGASLSLLVGTMVAAAALFALPAGGGSSGDGGVPSPAAGPDSAQAAESEAHDDRTPRPHSDEPAGPTVKPQRTATGSQAEASSLSTDAAAGGRASRRGRGSAKGRGEVAERYNRSPGSPDPAPGPRRDVGSGPPAPDLPQPRRRKSGGAPDPRHVPASPRPTTPTPPRGGGGLTPTETTSSPPPASTPPPEDPGRRGGGEIEVDLEPENNDSPDHHGGDGPGRGGDGGDGGNGGGAGGDGDGGNRGGDGGNRGGDGDDSDGDGEGRDGDD